ncbi:MAG: STAS domain-containing protein [Acidimicrobiales bacterium]
MQLEATQRTDGITQVALIGRLDVTGLHEVDIKFHGATAARKQPAIVDLSGLEYIASLGMGMLISCAQSLRRKGYSMVLVGATGDVDTALRTAGIDQAIPMVPDIDQALQLVAKA